MLRKKRFVTQSKKQRENVLRSKRENKEKVQLRNEDTKLKNAEREGEKLVAWWEKILKKSRPREHKPCILSRQDPVDNSILCWRVIL